MKQLVFTVYDQKAKAHLTPFFLLQEQQAIRAFTDCVNSDDHPFGKHPEDYTLIQIGEFDDSDGKLFPFDIPATIGTGINYLSHPTTPEPASAADPEEKSNVN